MRRLLVLGLLSSVLAFGVCAQQHAAVAAPAAPVIAHPVASGQAATTHLAPAHPPTHGRSGSDAAAPVRSKTPVTSHKPSGTATAQGATPVLGGAVNSIGAVNSVTGNRPPFCNHSRNGLPGVNACAPNNGVVIPYYGGGIYVPIPYYDYADNGAPDQEPPQEVAADQPPDGVPPGAEQGQQPTEAAQPGPSRYRSNDFSGSLAQFVFVERDGTKVYAVAYSFNNNKLQYVTPEGIRHTLAIDSLDFDATQKQNEKLGNTINLPSAPASGDA